MSTVTVLVCDHPQDLEGRAAAFESRGHTVERAADGYRAVELAGRTPAQALVLRLGVPGPAPDEVIARARGASSEDLRVICIMDGRAVEVASDLLRAGASAILLPDPSEEDLVRALEEVLGGGVVIDPALASDLVDRFSDVVQREREWAKSLADITQRAENLSTAKAEFLSNLSHELRTPLTVIKGVSQVVGKFGGADAAQASMMGQLEEAATKLTRMVENLLTLAEMERGEFGLDLQESDVAEITRETAEEVTSRYPDVKLDLRVPPAIPATCDPDRIREVLRHIIDNACRYSEEAGVVMVQARRAVEGVVVSVQDSGKGLDRGLVRAAFGEAFSVGEQVLTKERSGLGLGLNLARRLVMQHGGILTADPLPGGGSKVSFVIPPEPEPAAVAVAEPAANGHAPDAVEEDLLERLRILQRRLSDSESQAAT